MYLEYFAIFKDDRYFYIFFMGVWGRYIVIFLFSFLFVNSTYFVFKRKNRIKM